MGRKLQMNHILNQFPFLTLGKYCDQDILGIVGNSDSQILSMYVYSDIPTDDLKKIFLKYGDIWWWETNRLTPINIALKDKWKIFQPFLKTFVTKEFSIISGPCINLEKIHEKKIKKRQIQLIKKMA